MNKFMLLSILFCVFIMKAAYGSSEECLPRKNQEEQRPLKVETVRHISGTLLRVTEPQGEEKELDAIIDELRVCQKVQSDQQEPAELTSNVCGINNFKYIRANANQPVNCSELSGVEELVANNSKLYGVSNSDLRIKKSENVMDFVSGADGIVQIPFESYVMDEIRMGSHETMAVQNHELSHHFFTEHLAANSKFSKKYIELFRERSKLMNELPKLSKLSQSFDITCIFEKELAQPFQKLMHHLDEKSGELKRLNENKFIDNFSEYWMPYQELMADFSTVLLMDDLEAMASAIANDKSPDKFKRRAKLRSFSNNIAPKDLINEISPHTQLSAVRSYLGKKISEKGPLSQSEKERLFKVVLDSTTQYMEERWENSEGFIIDRDNQGLIDLIDKNLN